MSKQKILIQVVTIVSAATLALTLSSCSSNRNIGQVSPVAQTGTPNVAASVPASDEAAQSSEKSADSKTCLAKNLAGAMTEASGAAGTTYYTITLTNKGAPCETGGYAGVSTIGSAGEQLGAPATRNGTNFNKIEVATGATLKFILGVANAAAYDPAECQLTKATALKVYPPNDYTWLTIPTIIDTCNNPNLQLLSVDAVSLQ